MLKWIIFFPLLGFFLNGLWYAFFQTGQGQKKASASVTGALATAAIFASFIVSCAAFFALKSDTPVISEVLFNWIQVGTFQIDFGLRMDALNALFCLVITGVGSLIHLYSIGYMHDDESPGKFFAYLNLFCFSMLVLVLGSSLPVMFLGWEGVGLCSYLLIGYWYEDQEKASAGKKAFIVNRIGDFGFLLGMFLIYTTFGTLDFAALKEVVIAIPHQDLIPLYGAVITSICLLLFLGCTGKSAQIPLYVWLPDAMAGPTPVSALIHAATMVTSGIYLVSRLNFLYVVSPTALSVVAWVGALTAFFAATMAIAQTDIKKVLAYSTVSQLGYMFLGCGVGAFESGVFHVMTHAFFKALMFLGAGSVILGCHHEQDIMKMGGLKKDMPKTYLTFAAGWLAICGIPPLSGFFSKDEILWKAFSSTHGSTGLWLLGALTAVMTAFYMTRLFSLTFFGKYRGEHHAHESPQVVVIPLMILALLSVAGGWIGIPHFSWLEHWLDPIWVHYPFLTESTVNPNIEWVLMAVSVAGASFGIVLALRLYSDLNQVERLRQKWSSLNQVLKNKWYIDELYEAVIVRPIGAFSKALWKGFDVGVIDRFILGFGRVSQWTGQTLRVMQTGSLQAYIAIALMGLIFTVGYMLHGFIR